MGQKELLAPVYLKNGIMVNGPADFSPFGEGDAVAFAADCYNRGADAILLFDVSENESEHEASIRQIREIVRASDIPVYGGGAVRRMEDVKKLLYAGCQKVFLNYAREDNITLTDEVSSRFGKEKIFACAGSQEEFCEAVRHSPLLGGIVFLCEQAGTVLPEVSDCHGEIPDVLLLLPAQAEDRAIPEALRQELVQGVASDSFRVAEYAFMDLKYQLAGDGLPVNTYEPTISWEDLKQNSDGLVPVVVQDYRTAEVLMLAYMNREAFQATVRTGRMTYWSRSRSELWVKGLTSGHYQYVRELCLDCDSDTLLAKVCQIGAACHTGNRSCFYRSILKKEYDETNPLRVFEDVFAVIEDRKVHPKEGSYTNYLFQKGIDKILKKVGEEATEIIIAAKNPDPEEIKYEISDFLYHVMVLMAERGVTWDDITKELARR